MPWFDFLPKDEYQRWVERPRFEKATEPEPSWLEKAFETFRRGAEVAERAMVEPGIPMPVERAFELERPLMEQLPSPAYTEAGPTTKLALIYRDIQRRIERGELTAEQADFEWETAPETAFGNVQALGLGERRPHRRPSGPGIKGAIMGQVGEFITPLAPAEAFKFMEEIPVAGEFLEKAAHGIMTPAGLTGTAVWPGITAGMVTGGVLGGVAGKGLEAAGVPVADVGPMRIGPSGVLETVGALAGPVAGPAAVRAGVRGVTRGRAAVADVERLIPRKPPTIEAAPPPPLEDPVGRLTRLIRAAKPVRAETEALRHQVRVRQAAQLAETFKRDPGVETVRATRALKGELPKAAFEPPEVVLSTGEIRALRLRIHQAELRSFEELSTRQALDRLLAGQQPTWGDIAKLESVFGSEFARALESKMPLGKRAWRELWEAVGIPRAVQTAFDLSFQLRQGVLLGVRHPKEWAAGLNRSVRAFIKEVSAKERLDYWLGQKQAGAIPENTFIARFGKAAPFQERAEEFITKWASRIPGIRMSERAFATAGNEMRGGIARTLKGTWEARMGRSLTTDEATYLGRLVNYGTGRGPLPDDLRQALAGIFYAPGFRTSRPAYLSLLVNPNTPAFVRRMVAEELVAFVGAGTALLTILELSGAADVEVDPRSTDWGKIQIGKMRLDIWGGTQQMARLVVQLTTGQRKTLSTDEIMNITRQDTLARYAQSGLSPQFGAAVDVWRGETYSGEPLQPEAAELRTQLWNRMGPMSIQDIVEAVRVEGAVGASIAPFAFLGGGVWSPDIAGVRVNELTQRYDPQARRKNEMTGVEFDRLVDENPDLAQARREQVEYAANMGRDWALFTLQREEADAAFEDDFIAALLTPQGRTWRELSEEVGDHLREWAIRSDQFYGELDVDPRGELGKKIDAYYGTELPTFATDEERTAHFAEQERMLEENPDLAAAIRDNQILRFTDPDIRRFVRLRWDAQRLRGEYYNIPYKSRMPAEQQEQVRQYVRQAEEIARLQGVSFRRALMQTAIPQELIGLAIRYKRLPTSDARARFWRQYPEKEELYRTFYGEIPLDIEPEMAGVP